MTTLSLHSYRPRAPNQYKDPSHRYTYICTAYHYVVQSPRCPVRIHPFPLWHKWASQTTRASCSFASETISVKWLSYNSRVQVHHHFQNSSKPLTYVTNDCHQLSSLQWSASLRVLSYTLSSALCLYVMQRRVQHRMKRRHVCITYVSSRIWKQLKNIVFDDLVSQTFGYFFYENSHKNSIVFSASRQIWNFSTSRKCSPWSVLRLYLYVRFTTHVDQSQSWNLPSFRLQEKMQAVIAHNQNTSEIRSVRYRPKTNPLLLW